MQHLQLQHKEYRQLIFTTDGIRSLIIFHCPLDGEHTKRPGTPFYLFYSVAKISIAFFT
jgi:hypothetical protein